MIQQNTSDKENFHNYFSQIEQLLVERRGGKSLLLKAQDWVLIESWREQEIPLDIILSTINKIFDQIDKAMPARTIHSDLLP